MNAKTIEHLYTWADLNSKNSDSIKNWKDLYKGELKTSIKDEGSLFKEITMTADLIKQLIKVTETGAKISELATDKVYYIKLTQTLKLSVV